MFNLYFFEGEDLQGEKGEDLVREAARVYLSGRGAQVPDEQKMEICRTEKGKPYFPHLDVEFNVSHSSAMWVCLMGDTPCGIDLQEVTACEFKKIAAKYFTRQEQSYVFKHGIEGFFTIWTRREAFGKYTGNGFFGGDMPSFVGEDGELTRIFRRGEKTVYMREIPIASYIKCAYCNEEKNDEIQVFGG